MTGPAFVPLALACGVLAVQGLAVRSCWRRMSRRRRPRSRPASGPMPIDPERLQILPRWHAPGVRQGTLRRSLQLFGLVGLAGLSSCGSQLPPIRAPDPACTLINVEHNEDGTTRMLTERCGDEIRRFRPPPRTPAP